MKSEIRSPKKKRVTLRDVAEAAGVSRTAVSFVLNGREKGIAESTRKRIIETATRLGYVRPSSILNRRAWTRVAVLVHPPGRIALTSFYANVQQHLITKAHAHGLQIFSVPFDPDSDTAGAAATLPQLSDTGADVFLTSNRQWAALLKDRGLQVILYQGGRTPGVTTIHCDDHEAGRLAARHALEMGHTQAGTIAPDWRGHSRYSRTQGFAEAFAAGGGSIPRRWQWTLSAEHDKMIADLRARVKRRKLPTLFFCYADNFMLVAMRAFQLAGLQVPRDISLIGADDLYWGRYLTPALTTVNLREELFAEQLIKAIQHVAKGGAPYRLAVPVRLVPRETVRRLEV